ncbi:MAG: hypothetical protein AAF598_13570 [Bacteroidota bacterium]
MKHVLLSIALALGSFLSNSSVEAFTNSVQTVVGLHETVEVRITWSNPPLDEATDEMRIRIYDSSSTLKYDANHDQAFISISTAGWAAGAYTVVSTLPGFEEVDTFTL